jgi:site-specific DNA-methyltransferase (adenine-specific)
MNDQVSFTLRGRNPDVLTCIANLSNDEVFTPPEFANRMLDTLAEAWAANNNGANIWADSRVRFLDPFTKSGVFLREIASRLTKGLAAQMPNLQDRVDHILTGIRDWHDLSHQPLGPTEPVLLEARQRPAFCCQRFLQRRR